MYKPNNGLKEWSLCKKSFNTEFKKKCEIFGINKDNVRFYSQHDEEKYIIQYLLKEKINDGTFLEIGACDGILYSNTKTLEDYFGFKGILIEPEPTLFNKLKNSRNNDNNELYNCVVSNNDDEFIGNKKMKDILHNSNFKYIDFMIIDMNGSELSMLKSIDFKFPIFCIIIHANSGEQEKNRIIGNYLQDNGFTIKERQCGNEVWLNNNYFRKHLFHCEPALSFNDLNNSNKQIIKLIQKNEPFIVSRMGIGGETFKTYEYDVLNTITSSYLHPKTLTLYNAGIYYQKNDFNKLELFLKHYRNALFNSDILACFFNSSIKKIQDYFSHKYYLPQIHSRSLEPFYQIQEGIKPWTHYLLEKKVLVIHPFVESFKKQLNNDFQIFNDDSKRIFLKKQQFLFYKTFQTIAGNHIHDNWLETFSIMCDDIKELDFDIALLGCGGYGLPLCNFIKTKLNKSAIYIGGGLQLLFGVMGKRWENNTMWLKIISDNNTKFIKPSKEETCFNSFTIESGCYW